MLYGMLVMYKATPFLAWKVHLHIPSRFRFENGERGILRGLVVTVTASASMEERSRGYEVHPAQAEPTRDDESSEREILDDKEEQFIREIVEGCG